MPSLIYLKELKCVCKGLSIKVLRMLDGGK